MTEMLEEEGISYFVQESEISVLYTGGNKKEISLLSEETQNKILIDTGCSSTVAGRFWVYKLIDSLTPEMSKKVEKSISCKNFKFGSGQKYPSLGVVRIPLKMADKNVMLETDVVDMDLPCLLSRPALKRAGFTLLLETDEAIINGV